MMKMEPKVLHESQCVNKFIEFKQKGNHSVSDHLLMSFFDHKVTYQWWKYAQGVSLGQTIREMCWSR
jgi:hypothetical protein